MIWELALRDVLNYLRKFSRETWIRLSFWLAVIALFVAAIILPVREAQYLIDWHDSLKKCGWAGCRSEVAASPVQEALEIIRNYQR